MGVLHYFGGGVAGAGCHACFGEEGADFLLGFVGGPGFYGGADYIFLMLAPAGTGGEAGVGQPFGFLDDFAEAFPLMLTAYLDHEPAVFGFETGEDDRASRFRVAHHAHRFVLKLDISQRHHAIQHGDVHMLADAADVAVAQGG